MTPNQTILLRAVLTSPATTEDLAAMPKDNGDEFGENAARSAMKRLEHAGLVAGEGQGRSRLWRAIEAPAREALGLPSLDSTRDNGYRGYVVLEEVKLSDLIADGKPVDPDGVVYVKVAEVNGRNTEHAYRQAAKEAFADNDNAAPILVAVADKQWRPIPVRVQTRQTVSLG